MYTSRVSKPRKRHVQQELPYWGGKRSHAGRPPAGKRSSSPHKARAPINAAHPQHITMRVEPEVAALRRDHMLAAVRRALKTVAGRDLFRILDFSLQHGHVHLLTEAEHADGLARGMQAFQIAAARYINQAHSAATGSKRRGRVFVDRYHVRVLTTPRAVRHARAYVLNNWRRHREDRGWSSVNWMVDKFSSAVAFDGWKEMQGQRFSLPTDYELPSVAAARTWLASVGWKLHGLISTREVPGPKSKRLMEQ